MDISENQLIIYTYSVNNTEEIFKSVFVVEQTIIQTCAWGDNGKQLQMKKDRCHLMIERKGL